MPQPSRKKNESRLDFYSEAGGLTILAAAAEPDSGEAKLPRFEMVAYTGGAMRVGLWSEPMVLDLEGLTIPSQSQPIRFQHDASAGVGHTDTITIADGKLLATGVISRDTPEAREVAVSAKNGFPWQASIGASVDASMFIKAGETVTVNGREFSGPLHVVLKSTLGEMSFVDLGADSKTRATVAAESAKTVSDISGEKTMADENTEEMNKAEREKIRADAAIAERARLHDLQAAFPNDPAFAVEQFQAGVGVETAKAAYCDVLAAKVAASEEKAVSLQTQIDAAEKKTGKIDGAPPVTGSGEGGAGEGDFMATARAHAREQKISVSAAVRQLAKENPQLHEAWHSQLQACSRK